MSFALPDRGRYLGAALSGNRLTFAQSLENIEDIDTMIIPLVREGYIQAEEE